MDSKAVWDVHGNASLGGQSSPMEPSRAARKQKTRKDPFVIFDATSAATVGSTVVQKTR